MSTSSCQAESGAPSLWMAAYMVSAIWLLHSTAILLPWKAIIVAMSSLDTLDAPEVGSTKGVPQMASSPRLWLTNTLRLST